MDLSTITFLVLFLTTVNTLAGSKASDRLLSGNGKIPGRCEAYTGSLCSKYMNYTTVYVKPLRKQSMLEEQMKVAFRYFPTFLSHQCATYAYPALCLYAFPPCDTTVNYPKRRQFCREECEALQQHICEYEFNYGVNYMTKIVPSCSTMPGPQSPEHSKCVRLHAKIHKPVFKLRLKNVTANVGDTVVLKCKLRPSNIVPRITWYKDGKVIQPGHPSYKIHLFKIRSRMKIRHVKVEDSGRYKCEVTNVAWTISSESWINVNMTGFQGNVTKQRCGVLQPNSVCAPYLQNRSVYLESAQKQFYAEQLVRRAIKTFRNESSRCIQFSVSVMCYNFFPSCVDDVVKQSVCREDCFKIKNQICQEKMPKEYPQCSKLPKRFGRDGMDCKHFIYADKPVFKLALHNITASVGGSAILKCKVKSSKIAPTISWYKDGKVIESDHPFYKINLFRYSSRLEIRQVVVEDNGKYECRVFSGGWVVSSQGWVTVNITAVTTNITYPRCGMLQPTSVCAQYLKDQPVYLENARQEYNSEQLLLRSMKNFHDSSKCSDLALPALCYHFFPRCARSVKSHRLCREDCLKVRNKYCQKKVPPNYPQCSKLPKLSGREGRHCEIFKYATETQFKSCGVYTGNSFCGKYLANQTIYLYDAQQQYQMERQISFYLSQSIISQKCLRLGVPAMCYHLFPSCNDQGERRSSLCKQQCIKLKTEICDTEVALIKEVSSRHLKTMFPNCSQLPDAGHEYGKYCKQLDISTVMPSTTNQIFYDSNHECFNKSGVDYLGIHNISYRGNPCISWSITRPERVWAHNYCRNPDDEGEAPWCYVSKGKKEYCSVKECDLLSGKAIADSGGESTSLGRTIYVVIAIVAVILLGCITVVVYWKVQNSKENPDVSPAGSAVPFAKTSSTQLNDAKENSEIKSFVMREIMNRGKVQCISRMWEGLFCKVFKGDLVNEQGNPNMNIVIKALNEEATETEKELFAEETRLLCHLQHVNILGLLGISPTQDFVVFEYLSETNLRQFLELKSPESNEGVSPGVELLLQISTQIANGMRYLTEFNYIHGDLAARSCFITEDGQSVKISMLGMGSCSYPGDYEVIGERNGVFPIRWMSPECLETLRTTRENDVWAFGVTLWEIFACGSQPYSQHSNEQVIEKICAHQLLHCSEDWPKFVCHLTNQCWSASPSDRPNFDKIYENLNNEYLILMEGTTEVRL